MKLILLVTAAVILAAIVAWGQPWPHDPMPPLAPQITSPYEPFAIWSEPPEAHFRCIRLSDHRFRFEAIDSLGSPPVELTCVNCECAAEK